MNRAYLLIGGNMGDRMANIENACNSIEKKCGNIIARSSIYETAAWGIEQQPSFYNQALILDTELEPEVLMKTLLDIETKMGRVRYQKYGPRIIDIDILFIENMVVQSTILIAPHPLLSKRRFALEPLAEIASEVIVPLAQKTVATLLAECQDPLQVNKLQSDSSI